MQSVIDYDSLGSALRALGLGQEAAEYHGILCGMLCVRGSAPDDLGLEPVSAPSPDERSLRSARELVGGLRSESLDALADPDMNFSLLLPDDDEALAQRVSALAEWCQGFLFGISSAAQLDLAQASPELREAVNDLVQISRAGLEPSTDDDDGAGDEEAYAEVLEYVRAAVQLIFLELHAAAGGSRQGTLH